jgi:hypothetical protein
MTSRNSSFIFGAVLCCIVNLTHAAQSKDDPFVEFQNRFGGNQEFVCTSSGGKKPSVSVSVPQADSEQMKTIPRSQWGEVLSVYLSKGNGVPIDSSWGVPTFDRSMKFMWIQLHDGKTLIFERFRNIPDPDADPQHFDHRPYFDLSIDGQQKMPCSQVINLP